MAPALSGDRPPARGRMVGLVVGVTTFVILLLLPPPGDMPIAAWRTVAVAALMAIWWVSEAIPVAATALLPVVLFPILDIASLAAATQPFANPLIFLFLGGFILALTVQRWGLHRRVATNLVALFGTKPRGVVAGFMAATAFLSMWLSNTASAMLMLPIAVAVLGERIASDNRERAVRHYATALMLAIAYGANIGGLGTLIGTPPNALMAGFMLETYGIEIGFGVWMLFGVPLVLVLLPIVWFLLVRVSFPAIGEVVALDKPGEMKPRLGAMSVAEKRTMAIFILAGLMWICRPFFQNTSGLDIVSDSGVAIFCALLTFIVPAGISGSRLMDWAHAKALPWGILILFGGGLSLAAAFQNTGLASWIGDGVEDIGVVPLLALTLAIVTLVIFLTELTSNTATAATFLPVVAAVSVSQTGDPILLSIAVALAASCAFMLPVATPPNAIVFGSGYVTIPQMARAGFAANLTAILVLTAFAHLVAPLIFLN